MNGRKFPHKNFKRRFLDLFVIYAYTCVLSQQQGWYKFLGEGMKVHLALEKIFSVDNQVGRELKIVHSDWLYNEPVRSKTELSKEWKIRI